MRNLDTVDDDELARCLYALTFERREFSKLPVYVQDSYRRDAARIKQWITNATHAASSRR